MNFKTCRHWKSGAEDDESAPERSGTGREDPSSTNSRFSKVRFLSASISFRTETIFSQKLKGNKKICQLHPEEIC